MVHRMKGESVRGLAKRARQVMSTTALLFGLLAVSTPATAAIITVDFNNLAPGALAGDQPVAGGLLIYNVNGQAAFDVGGGNIAMVDVDPFDASGNTGILRLAGGGTFQVLSIDIADLTNDPERRRRARRAGRVWLQNRPRPGRPLLFTDIEHVHHHRPERYR